MIQQNSFNLTSDNLEILIFEHIKNIVSKPEVSFYQKEKFIKERGRFQGHVQNGLQSVCTPIIVVPPKPFPPTPQISSLIRTPKNAEEVPVDHETGTERDIQSGTLLCLFVQPKCRTASLLFLGEYNFLFTLILTGRQ